MQDKIEICYSRTIENNFKSFNATFEPKYKSLVLPSYLIEAMEQASGRKVHIATQAMSILYTSPTYIASLIGWKAEDVIVATAELAELVKGYMPDFIRLPQDFSRPPLGAFDPKEK